LSLIAAIASISTKPPFGNAFTANVERAGYGGVKTINHIAIAMMSNVHADREERTKEKKQTEMVIPTFGVDFVYFWEISDICQ
jgi:hypothetical protein